MLLFLSLDSSKKRGARLKVLSLLSLLLLWTRCLFSVGMVCPCYRNLDLGHHRRTLQERTPRGSLCVVSQGSETKACGPNLLFCKQGFIRTPPCDLFACCPGCFYATIAGLSAWNGKHIIKEWDFYLPGSLWKRLPTSLSLETKEGVVSG